MWFFGLRLCFILANPRVVIYDNLIISLFHMSWFFLFWMIGQELLYIPHDVI